MKKIHYEKHISIPTKEMIHKKNEERYYNSLERTFKTIEKPSEGTKLIKEVTPVQRKEGAQVKASNPIQ